MLENFSTTKKSIRKSHSITSDSQVSQIYTSSSSLSVSLNDPREDEEDKSFEELESSEPSLREKLVRSLSFSQSLPDIETSNLVSEYQTNIDGNALSSLDDIIEQNHRKHSILTRGDSLQNAMELLDTKARTDQ